MNNLTTRNRDNVFDDSEFSIRVLEIPGKSCDSDDDVVLYTPGIRP